MTGKQRKTALVAALFLVCVLLVSVLVPALEADHECVGEDCPVCAMISLCGSFLRAGALLFCRLIALTTGVVAVLFVKCAVGGTAFATLVSQKIKLSA